MSSEMRRILVAAAISVVLMIAWQKFFAPPPKGPPPPGPADAGATAAPAAPAPAGAATPAPAPAPAPAEAPEEVATLETDLFAATFTTEGGALKSFRLKEKKFHRDEGGKEERRDLVAVTAGEPYPLSLVPSPELGGPPGLEASGRTPMRIAGRDDKSVTFEGRVGSIGVRKRFALGTRPYEIDGEVSLLGVERPGAVALLYTGFLPPDAPKPGLLTGGEVFEVVRPLCRAGTSTERFGGEKPERPAGAVAWLGLDQHYFVSAVIPAEPGGECLLERWARPGASLAALRLPVQGDATFGFHLFAGPKRIELLRAYGRDLDTAIDYGPVTNFFAFFARILLWLMKAFHGVVQNWGLAIILLTVLVKVVLYPLTRKSMQSMQEMRKLQPEIEALKAKFGDDKEKLNMAVMQLYQQHKVNPLGGCLPMLVQLPIWFALYATLQTSVELYREPFLWIRDLTRFDPFYVLPVTMGASSFAMQKLAPQPADSTQAKMLLYFMPAFFTLLMLRLPAGLTLYILVNNLLSIAQQQWMLRPRGPRGAKA